MRDPGPGFRDPAKMLFLDRLARIFRPGGKVNGELTLFLTGGEGGGEENARIDGLHLPYNKRRITAEDIIEKVGGETRATAVYICGVPKMTDELVESLTSHTGLGLEPHRVLYEKWW